MKASGVVNRLKKMSVVPERTGTAFETWLEQTDAIQFLEQNTLENEFVVFATLDHIYIRVVLVPSDRLNPPDMEDLLKWEFLSDTWRMNYYLSDDNPTVWIESPLESAGSESLSGAEPLVFVRSFDGYDDKKTHV